MVSTVPAQKSLKRLAFFCENHFLGLHLQFGETSNEDQFLWIFYDIDSTVCCCSFHSFRSSAPISLSFEANLSISHILLTYITVIILYLYDRYAANKTDLDLYCITASINHTKNMNIHLILFNIYIVFR